MKVKQGTIIDDAKQKVELALLRDLKEEQFSVISQQDILSSVNNILRILSIGLGAVAGVSLLVGGIGVMNIMLVSVTERTNEIGLRKAVGATSYNVGLQFLSEAIFISVVGGMVGLGLSWLVTFGVQKWLRAEIPLWAVFLAVGFSMFVGVIFGTYPAIKASKKDPIEALRFE